MIDRYTKIVLTVIAVALAANAIQNLIPRSYAQMGQDNCGTTFKPCYLATARFPLEIRIVP